MHNIDLTKKSLTGLWIGDCIGNIGQLYFAQDILKALDEGLAKFGNVINPAGQHFHLSDDTEEAIVLVNHLNKNARILQDEYAFELAKRFYERDPDGEIYGYGLMTRTVLKDIYFGKHWGEANQTKPRIEGPSLVDKMIGEIVSGKSVTDAMAVTNVELQKEIKNKPELKIGSCGNGSAMRVPPLGAYALENRKSIQWLIDQATLQSQVTHCHSEGIAGSIATAIITNLFSEIFYNSYSEVPYGHGLYKQIHIADLLYDLLLNYIPESKVKEGIRVASSLSLDEPLMKVIEVLGNGTHVTCQDTVPLCIYLSIRGLVKYSLVDLYEKTIIDVCNCFGDVDTNCAIVGGIVSVISEPPTKWIGYCEPMEGVLGDPLPPARKPREHKYHLDKSELKSVLNNTEPVIGLEKVDSADEYEYSNFQVKTPPDFMELVKNKKKVS